MRFNTTLQGQWNEESARRLHLSRQVLGPRRGEVRSSLFEAELNCIKMVGKQGLKAELASCSAPGCSGSAALLPLSPTPGRTKLPLASTPIPRPAPTTPATPTPEPRPPQGLRPARMLLCRWVSPIAAHFRPRQPRLPSQDVYLERNPWVRLLQHTPGALPNSEKGASPQGEHLPPVGRAQELQPWPFANQPYG